LRILATLYTKDIHIKIESWLKELQESLMLIDSDDINVEARDNMFAFGISEGEAKKFGEDEIHFFIKKCCEIYASNCSDNTKLYYCWLDEMAGQLRMGAVSNCHSGLPFGGNVHDCTLPELVQSIVGYDSGTYTKSCLNVWKIGACRHLFGC
jgi:hypothetical protein